MDLKLDLHVKGNNFFWNIRDSRTSKCVSYYRIVYWDERNEPIDMYVSDNNFTLLQVVPCMSYNIQVTGVISNPNFVGPVASIGLLGSPAGS